ncbi:Monooxygenase FAD-binding [Penicillium sp. IBT 18751x]|nr:Monooxygenase FAD-binding [Penicillium sp. IBT 18751x]
MRALIVGAGLGGLTCAISSRQQGIDVVILERSPELLKKGNQVQHVDFRRYQDGRLLRSMPFGDDITQEFGSPWVLIHRIDYHRILLDEAIRLGAVLMLGAEVENVSVEAPEVILTDGRKLSADVLIGADGQWSTIRKAVLRTPMFPVETGDLAYRATFTRGQLETLGDDKVNELIEKVSVTSWLGPEKHTIFYPVRGGQEFNLVLLRPDNLAAGTRRVEGDVEEMRESYAGWDETLQKLISCVPTVYKWKLTSLPELETWTKGAVALLGDACHPTLPYQAQGAAMAVEDGAVIGKLLGFLQDRNLSNDSSLVASVLKIYEQIRKTRTTRNVHGAAMNRQLFHIDDGIFQIIRDFALRYAGVTRKSDWTWFSSFRQRQTLGNDVLRDCERVLQAWEIEILQQKKTQ